MASTKIVTAERTSPTRSDALLFRFKATLLQLRRGVQNHRATGNGGRGIVDLDLPEVIATSTTPLWTESSPAERFLVAGKIHNLRIASARLNGTVIAAGETFSFWKVVGRTARRRGYVRGRELREGCLIPSIGGGLCQLSNALYDAALKAGFEIVERHAHTQVIPGSLAEQGRDATVFWNYVDLRFRSPDPFRIQVILTDTELAVSFRGSELQGPKLHRIARTTARDADAPQSCASCGRLDCHRENGARSNVDLGGTGYLLDEYSPEFDRYIGRTASASDLLCIPIDGKRFHKSGYAWTTGPFGRVKQSFVTTARRSYHSRRLTAQGAERQKNLLQMSEKLAAGYARQLGFQALHLVIQQGLLAYLWRAGHLGGRTFDVLMNTLPMAALQQELDRAADLHPESRTLGDFRADAELVAAESEALKRARRIITPHHAVAKLFPGRVELLDWAMPNVAIASEKHERARIVFPAATVGRKGCYELRDALEGLDVELVPLGPLIESDDFWKGFRTVAGGPDWLDSADVVVLPAFVEHRPRRLLSALAAGVPVIATPACGLGEMRGLETVPSGDAAALRSAIIADLERKNISRKATQKRRFGSNM